MMGVFKKKCWSSPYAVQNSAPNPTNFTVVNTEVIGDYLVVNAKYPDCTNLEGSKLMVYKGFKSIQELLIYNKGELDPHFSGSKGSPIARFHPDLFNTVSVMNMIASSDKGDNQ